MQRKSIFSLEADKKEQNNKFPHTSKIKYIGTKNFEGKFHVSKRKRKMKLTQESRVHHLPKRVYFSSVLSSREIQMPNGNGASHKQMTLL